MKMMKVWYGGGRQDIQPDFRGVLLDPDGRTDGRTKRGNTPQMKGVPQKGVVDGLFKLQELIGRRRIDINEGI
jgi:hypothetical protein